MSKPLEALRELKQKRFYSNGVGVDLEDSYPELFDIIEQALIEKEEYKKKVKRYFELMDLISDKYNIELNIETPKDDIKGRNMIEEMILLEQELKGEIK